MYIVIVPIKAASQILLSVFIKFDSIIKPDKKEANTKPIINPKPGDTID